VCPQPAPLSLAAQQPRLVLDHDILAAFTASVDRNEQLSAAAHRVTETLLRLGLPQQYLVLYGSLSLARLPCWFETSDTRGLQNVPTSYATNLSDVDIAVLLQERISASTVVESFLNGGASDWRQVQARLVPRFAVAQWTLVSQMGIHLDLTCISDAAHFQRFKERQVAFRQVFWQMRQHMQLKYGVLGGVSFDAYIYLLKAFAAFVSRSAFTSFQATCLGLFVMQRTVLNKQQLQLPPTAIFLFERFLRFCRVFFSAEGGPRRKAGRQQAAQGHRVCAIDLSGEGRLMHRYNPRSCAELYFADVELHFRAPASEWLNVLHSSDPKVICSKARMALDRWFGESNATKVCATKVWANIRQDLVPSMRPAAPKPS